jgi:transposase
MTNTTKTNISDLEKQLLKQYAKSAPLVLVRFKAQAILLASNGVAITAIADVMDKKPRTIGLWLHNWHEHRVGSIFTGHQDNNNASKLTLEQKAEIQQTLQSPPSDFGLPKEFWDVPQLKAYVTVSSSLFPEHQLPKFSGWS